LPTQYEKPVQLDSAVAIPYFSQQANQLHEILGPPLLLVIVHNVTTCFGLGSLEPREASTQQDLSRCRYTNTARPLRDIRFDRSLTDLRRKRCVAARKSTVRNWPDACNEQERNENDRTT
jgi:hypothetical protein